MFYFIKKLKFKKSCTFCLKRPSKTWIELTVTVQVVHILKERRKKVFNKECS